MNTLYNLFEVIKSVIEMYLSTEITAAFFIVGIIMFVYKLKRKQLR